jgi:hypothetical protein
MVSILTNIFNLGNALLGGIHKLKISIKEEEYVASKLIIQRPPSFIVS